jgi:hypothetical protein
VEIIDRLEESLPGKFEPDTLLPTQYYEIMRRRHSLEGERKLMFAVLEDAVECYLKNMNARPRKQRILFYEAQNWMYAKHKVGLFAFETLCEALGIEPVILREALESRRRMGQAGSIRLSNHPRRSSRRRRQMAQQQTSQPAADAVELSQAS